MKKNILCGMSCMLIVLFGTLFTSFSGDDYVNVIPGNSKALGSLDLKKLSAVAGDNGGDLGFVKSLLGVSDMSGCGIDFGSKIYLFESAEGNIGLVAKVSDDGDLEKNLSAQAAAGRCTAFTERKGYKFTLLKDSWVIGFSSKALLVMGPVVASQQPQVQQQMAKLLGQDEDRGIKGTPMFDKADSIDAPVALVAQAAALPEIPLPLMLGVPKDADASQVMVAAGMTVADGCLSIACNTFSLNHAIDAAMRQAWKTYRPVGGKMAKNLSTDAVAGVFVNADGAGLLEQLRANKSLQALLAGINTAIDMDNIIRCIDGDTYIALYGYNGDIADVQMAAQLGNRDFLADVDYWKKSCPPGSSITDWGKDAYRYTNGTLDFYFGVTENNMFYSGSTPEKAKASLTAAASPYKPTVTDRIAGSRLSVVLSLNAILGGSGNKDVFRAFVKPLFGNVDAIVLTAEKY